MYKSNLMVYILAGVMIVIFLIAGIFLIVQVPYLSILGYALVLVTPLIVASMFSPFYADLIFMLTKGGKITYEFIVRGKGRGDIITHYGRCTIDFLDGVEVCRTGEGLAAAYVRVALYTKPQEIYASSRENVFEARTRRIVDALRAILSYSGVLNIEIVALPDLETLKIATAKLMSTAQRSATYAETHRIEVLKSILQLASEGKLTKLAIILTVGTIGSESNIDELKKNAKEAANHVRASLGAMFRVEVLKSELLAVYMIMRRFRPPLSYDEAIELLGKIFAKSGIR